jgi:hypothetical protein
MEVDGLGGGDKMRPMSEFEPAQRAMVHDKLTGEKLAWQPEWAEHYREHKVLEGHGVIGWDGLLLDGWTAVS